MLSTLLIRWREGLREVFESALAAALAFWIGQQVFGSEHTPLFAGIAAIICLSPGLPSHSKQALGMLAGVIAGIVVGEVALSLAAGVHPALLGLTVFVSMMLAIALDVRPIIGIQSGVSALIVLVEGTAASSYARIVDAGIGGLVALAFSQVLFTPDPFRIIREGAHALLDEAQDMRGRFDDCRLGSGSSEDLRQLLAELRDAEQTLTDRLGYAEQIANRTLRGRWRRDAILAATGEWRHKARELHLALGTMAYTLEHADQGKRQARCEEHLREADELLQAGREALA